MAYIATRPKTKGKYRGRGFERPAEYTENTTGSSGVTTEFPRHNRGQGND